jgi:hypothetical protein
MIDLPSPLTASGKRSNIALCMVKKGVFPTFSFATKRWGRRSYACNKFFNVLCLTRYA